MTIFHVLKYDTPLDMSAEQMTKLPEEVFVNWADWVHEHCNSHWYTPEGSRSYLRRLLLEYEGPEL